MDKSFLELVYQQKSDLQVKNNTPAAEASPGSESGDIALARYETPLVTVDVVVFTIIDNQLKVLLVQRKNHPYQHMWSIPGGFIHVGETLEKSAERYLDEKTNVKNIYLEQLATFGHPDRDPRSRVITVSYYALVCQDHLEPLPKEGVERIDWFDIEALPQLAFDHRKIVQAALNRMKEQLENSSIAFQLLPEKFTLTELQRVYELILGKILDKRNFRKKILATGVLRDLGETKMEGYHRPAQLYTFMYQPGTVQDAEQSLAQEQAS